jgi:hypothetical protein
MTPPPAAAAAAAAAAGLITSTGVQIPKPRQCAAVATKRRAQSKRNANRRLSYRCVLLVKFLSSFCRLLSHSLVDLMRS